MSINIAIASDHAGFDAKEILRELLLKDGFKVTNLGTDSSRSVDYPDYAKIMAENIDKKDANIDFGVLICGTGIGISIAANRFRNIRCALIKNANDAKLCKQHNNANVLAFGKTSSTPSEMFSFIKIYENAVFEGGRHQLRLDKIK